MISNKKEFCCFPGILYKLIFAETTLASDI